MTDRHDGLTIGGRSSLSLTIASIVVHAASASARSRETRAS
jgi:hypothetical protein